MKKHDAINDIIIKSLSGGELSSGETALLNEWLSDEGNRKLFEDLKNTDYLKQRLQAAHAIDIIADKKLLDERIAEIMASPGVSFGRPQGDDRLSRPKIA